MYPRYSSAVVGYTRPGSAAPFGLTKPAPWANGSSALETVSPALVMIADLISDGSHVGWSALTSAPMPAMCGEAIEVPDRKSNIRPWLLGGATAATTSLPGAAMSGLRMSPPVVVDGPRDEKSVISGTWGAAASSACVSGTIFAGAAAPADAMYALTAAPSTLLMCVEGIA